MKKLSLHKETLRQLAAESSDVNGGVPVTVQSLIGCTSRTLPGVCTTGIVTKWPSCRFTNCPVIL